MARNKRVSQEEIPDMIQQILPVWQKEIDRLQSLPTPTRDDIKLSINLAASLSTMYIQYRVLKQEIKKETQQLPVERLAQILSNAKTN